VKTGKIRIYGTQTNKNVCSSSKEKKFAGFLCPPLITEKTVKR